MTNQHQCGAAVEGFYCQLSFRTNWFETALTLVIPSHKCTNVGRVDRVRGQVAIETHIDVKNIFLDPKPPCYGSVNASGLRPYLAQSQRNIALHCIAPKSKKVHSLSWSPMSYSSSLYLATQFFWIRQTTHGILCISSFWQALKALTNDSLIQRKTEGGEGEADKNNGLPQLWGAC